MEEPGPLNKAKRPKYIQPGIHIRFPCTLVTPGRVLGFLFGPPLILEDVYCSIVKP